MTDILGKISLPLIMGKIRYHTYVRTFRGGRISSYYVVFKLRSWGVAGEGGEK